MKLYHHNVQHHLSTTTKCRLLPRARRHHYHPKLHCLLHTNTTSSNNRCNPRRTITAIHYRNFTKNSPQTSSNKNPQITHRLTKKSTIDLNLNHSNKRLAVVLNTYSIGKIKLINFQRQTRAQKKIINRKKIPYPFQTRIRYKTKFRVRVFSRKDMSLILYRPATILNDNYNRDDQIEHFNVNYFTLFT